ncbi:MAG: hypothetical protein ACI8S6_000910 [Myxococcota bacterium]|jgi:hypothetical protein
MSYPRRAFDPRALPATERDALMDTLYDVHQRVFAGVERASFGRYILNPRATRSRLQLFFDESGEVIGCTSFRLFSVSLEGRPATVMRGAAGILPAHRGQSLMWPLFVSEVFRLLRHPFLPAPYDTRPVSEHFKLMLADDESLSFVGFARPIAGSIHTITELQSRCLAAMCAGKIPVPGERQKTIARDQAYARRRFQSTRIAGLVDMVRYLDGLASWLGVQPDYGRLFRESPRQWWSALVAPYNGALYWLSDDTRREDALKQMTCPKYVIQHSLHAWALILYRNAFPVRRLNVFSYRPRSFRWRQLMGLLLAPVFLPAGLMISQRSPLLQLYGALLLTLLSPILITRLIARRRELVRINAEYQHEHAVPAQRPTARQGALSRA